MGDYALLFIVANSNAVRIRTINETDYFDKNFIEFSAFRQESRTYLAFWNSRSLILTNFIWWVWLTVRCARSFTIVEAQTGPNKCLLYRIAGCPLFRGF